VEHPVPVPISSIVVLASPTMLPVARAMS